MRIIYYPDPILRKKSREVSFQELHSPKFQSFIRQMKKNMHQANGVGLAAPQVGENIRLIVVLNIDSDLVVVNPKLSRFSWRKNIGEEGCLSLPQIFGMVKRSSSVCIQGWNENGKSLLIKAHGFLARVFQHEADHLDGILFIDKALKITRKDVSKEK